MVVTHVHNNAHVLCLSSVSPDLSQVVQYHGGYHNDHPVIRTFWKVFHDLPQEGKRKFLGWCMARVL